MAEPHMVSVGKCGHFVTGVSGTVYNVNSGISNGILQISVVVPVTSVVTVY